jgi:hypothetical protein
MKNLEQQINELNENLAKQLPAEVLEVFGKSISELKTQGSVKRASKKRKSDCGFFPWQLVSLLQS